MRKTDKLRIGVDIASAIGRLRLSATVVERAAGIIRAGGRSVVNNDAIIQRASGNASGVAGRRVARYIAVVERGVVGPTGTKSA